MAKPKEYRHKQTGEIITAKPVNDDWMKSMRSWVPSSRPWEDEVTLNIETLQMEWKTLEGPKVIEIGDWVIAPSPRELTLCKKDVFERDYEPVRETQ